MEQAIEHASHSFDSLLKSWRKRRHLTQLQLAQKIGVHLKTIGGWEYGRTRPENKTLVLDLARALYLNEQESRQFLEASFTAPASLWYVPSPRNLYFTGREETLATLHMLLATQQRVALTQSLALHGLGGIGKTQLALEYAYRHALEYTAVLWISAETAEHISSIFAAIAELLQLPERQEADQQHMMAAVQRWLNTRSGWLLIWDNLEDLDLLKRFLSGTPQGRYLVTTRTQVLGTLAQGLELFPLPDQEALFFLFRRAKRLPPPARIKHLSLLAQRSPEEYQAAQALVHLLGGLPLALDQAAAYIEETGCGFVSYVKRYQDQRGLLLARRGPPGADHPQSVMTTFALAHQHLEPAAADLLRLCAFLAAEEIPEELFHRPLPPLGGALGGLGGDPLQLDLTFATLRRFSLVQRHGERQTLSVHRLVQAVQQECLDEESQRRWAKQVVYLVAAAFPDPKEFTAWPQCQRLLPHALMCASHIERWSFTFPEGASLLDQVGLLLRLRAQHQEALPLLQRALAMREQVLGPAHPDVATSLNNLGILYYAMAHYPKALPLLQRALAIREQTFGPDHPRVAQSLNNLALLDKALGQDAEALPLHQRALTIREQSYGPDYPDVAISLSGLAGIHKALGEYQEALPLLQRALTIREQAFGPDHPDVADSWHALAAIYQPLERYGEASPCLERALAIRTHQLGPEHPKTAQTLASLAEIQSRQGQLSEARRLYQQALTIQEARLGIDHPETIKTRTQSAHLMLPLAHEPGVHRRTSPPTEHACGW